MFRLHFRRIERCMHWVIIKISSNICHSFLETFIFVPKPWLMRVNQTCTSHWHADVTTRSLRTRTEIVVTSRERRHDVMQVPRYDWRQNAFLSPRLNIPKYRGNQNSFYSYSKLNNYDAKISLITRRDVARPSQKLNETTTVKMVTIKVN